MFTKAEKQLIRDLERRPLSELARYFPDKTHREISLELSRERDLERVVTASSRTIREFLGLPPLDDTFRWSNGWTKEDYALSMKKGSIYLLDSHQENFVLQLHKRGYRPEDMDSAFYHKFGILRTSGALRSRLEKILNATEPR